MSSLQSRSPRPRRGLQLCAFFLPLILLWTPTATPEDAFPAACADFLRTPHTRLLAIQGDFAAKPAPAPAAVEYARDGTACRRECVGDEIKLRALAGGNTVSLLVAKGESGSCLAVDFDGARTIRFRPGTGPVMTPLRRTREVRTLSGHAGEVPAAAFSPDGRYALTGGKDGVVRGWDLRDGSTVRTLAGHRGGVYAVAFSADGKRAITGGFDEVVRVWDLASGAALRALEGHAHLVSCVAFSPDGRRAVSGGWDQRLILWNLDSGARIDEINLESTGDYPAALAVSPDGRRFLAGTKRGVVLEFAWN